MIRCGCDILEISRVEALWEKQGEAFLSRFLDEEERALCRRIETAAGFFAAKEAAAKALGTGIWGEAGVSFLDFKITKDALGAPQLSLRGTALLKAAELGELQSLSLSISHDGGLAFAVSVMEFA